MSEVNDDNIKKKIYKIYQNYDIDIDEITEDELSRLQKYYSKNLKKLDFDLKESKKVANNNAGEKDE